MENKMKTKKDLDDFWFELVEKSNNIRSDVENNPKEFINLNILKGKSTPPTDSKQQVPQVVSTHKSIVNKKEVNRLPVWAFIFMEILLISIVCYQTISHYNLLPSGTSSIGTFLQWLLFLSQ